LTRDNLGRYLYRGVLLEKDILGDRNGLIAYRIRDKSGAEQIQSLSGANFLWMLLRPAAWQQTEAAAAGATVGARRVARIEAL
jgi:hypothetical protein